MKSVNKILDRLFEGKKPLKSKWWAYIEDDKVFFNHYQHLILIYDISKGEDLYSFSETKTDQRGINSAIAYLEKRNGKESQK